MAHGEAGRIPRAFDIYFEPGNSQHILLRSDTRGMFQSVDGGATWSWFCAEAYQGASLQAQRLGVALLPGGTILVANRFRGLLMSRGDGCSFEPAPEFEGDGGGSGDLVQDVRHVVSTSSARALTATGPPPFRVNVWESMNAGETWTTMGGPSGGDFSGTPFLTAPSEPDRIYISGKMPGRVQGAVRRSTDGGRTWEAFELDLGLADDDFDWSSRLAAVDAQDPDVLYYWLDRADVHDPDQLWVSTDGAATWIRVFAGIADLTGSIYSPDGAKFFVSGPDDGLWSAAAPDMLARGQAAFSQVFEGQVWGLAWNDGELFAGGNDFTAGFTLGVSGDDGATYQAVMSICDAELVECPTDSFTARACTGQWESEFEPEFLLGEYCTGSVSDAGGLSDGSDLSAGSTDATGDRSDNDGGCGCRVLRSDRPTRPAAAAVVALMAIAGALHRRRRGSRGT